MLRGMDYTFTELTISEYPQVLELMKRTPGISVREADSLQATQRYLERNPGLSFVAIAQGRVIGCAMAGHDGRRGYLQHVVVDLVYRKQGIAQALVDRCLKALAGESIEKVHLDVLCENQAALEYWQKRGWQRREDIARCSYIISGVKNA